MDRHRLSKQAKKLALETIKKPTTWWDIPQGLTGNHLRKIIQQKNTDVLRDLVTNPSKLGLSIHSEPEPVQDEECEDYVATNPQQRLTVMDKLHQETKLKRLAVHRGNFTPLTEPYKALGAMTVFDEMLIRKAIKSHIPTKLQSMENLRPHSRQKFQNLEKVAPLMHKKLTTAVHAETMRSSRALPLGKKKHHFRPAGTLRSKSDGGFISWKIFMKEMQRGLNKVIRGRQLPDFMDQSNQFMEKELGRMRLKTVVAFLYDSPHFGGVQHMVHSATELQRLLDSAEPDVQSLERLSFLSYLRWIDILLTSVTNVRLREILCWEPLPLDRVDEIRHNYNSHNLTRSPSVAYHPKFRALKHGDAEEDLTDSISGSASRTGRSKMNVKEQIQLLWRKFHRDKMAGRFDRPRPSGNDIDEWRYRGSPPWLEIISKVQTRFQAVRSELSMQTIAKKTVKKVTEENAEDLISAIHDRWKKAERAKRLKYEKFLRRKKESVYWTLQHPSWIDKPKRIRHRPKENKIPNKDKLRVNTWFHDLQDQCQVVMGTPKPVRLLEQFSQVSWDHYNFALERLALVICSLSGRELTNHQMQAAARFVLREILAGPEDLVSRCYAFRGLAYQLPFLRPGRGDSIVLDAKPVYAELASLKSRGVRTNFLTEAMAALKSQSAATKSSTGPTRRTSEEKSERPDSKLKGSLKPVVLPGRSPTARLKKKSLRASGAFLENGSSHSVQ